MARILHIGKYFPPFQGGMENFLADLMLAQSRLGHSVAVLAHDHQARLSRLIAPVQPEMWHGVPVYRGPSYGRLLYSPISPHFPYWLHRVLTMVRPDILHLHLPNPSAFCLLGMACARRIPWVIQWQSDVISDKDKRLGLAYRLYRPFEQRLLRHTRAVVVASPPYLESSVPLRPWLKKCRAIPLGVDTARVPEATAEAIHWANQQWHRPGFRVLAVGRLTYYKGHEVLIRAMRDLHEIQTLIVGEGEQRPRLEALIQELAVGNRVKLMGHCSAEELIGLLSTCDAFCLPSLERTEAFGVALVEAMRYGKPVVTCAIPGSGVQWVVQDGQTGIIVPPANPEQLARGLRRLATEPALGLTMGQNGYRRFVENFDIRQVAVAMDRLYREM